MIKGTLRLQKGLLAIEEVVKSKHLTSDAKVDSIEQIINLLWSND